MKRSILLLTVLSLFWACQKKEYATFTYSQSAYMYQPKSTAPSPIVSAAAPQPMSASSTEGLSTLTDEEMVLSSIPTEAVSLKKEQSTSVVNQKVAPAKMTWQQKVIAKKIQKQLKKVDSPEKAKAIKAKPDTIALLSLIFGGAGLLLLLAGAGLGLLLGLAGMVLGIIGLGRVKNGVAPASSKTIALLGVILGGLVVLIVLIVVAAFASYGFS